MSIPHNVLNNEEKSFLKFRTSLPADMHADGVATPGICQTLEKEDFHILFRERRCVSRGSMFGR